MSSSCAPVLIAGASGFVGRALLRALAGRRPVIALSRGPMAAEAGVEWRECDLFSLLQIERAMKGARIAVYLVHSMLPARLTQARFEDMDLILADNFARAAAGAGVERILYLGGLVPENDPLSQHLASRLEVEEVLGSRSVPVTTLRAGLILGAGGSSFRMMLRLVERLPVMLCPRWTSSRTQPIALDDIVHLILRCLEDPATAGRVYDVGGPEVLTYTGLMRRTAAVLGRGPWIFTVPFLTPRLSVLWIRLVSGAHGELIRPLVESLRHDMVAGDSRMLRVEGRAPVGIDDALARAIREERVESVRRPVRRHLAQAERSSGHGVVVSIQRLPLPPGRDAQWVAREYARWLPTRFRPFLRVRTVGEPGAPVLVFELPGMGAPLLELSFSANRSSPDRPLFYITGGCLVAPEPDAKRAPARLEFRATPSGQEVMAAVFNFRPRLPWLIYRLTQAPVHLAVMQLFAAHLNREKGQSAGG